eukprot:2156988-Amphidinium_carterae.1
MEFDSLTNKGKGKDKDKNKGKVDQQSFVNKKSCVSSMRPPCTVSCILILKGPCKRPKQQQIWTKVNSQRAKAKAKENRHMNCNNKIQMVNAMMVRFLVFVWRIEQEETSE